MGAAIISAIESGLGLISELASQFLTGFTALFWDAGNSALTTFGMFALVFLGVSISFAVIKLCLNVVRSNTGV